MAKCVSSFVVAILIAMCPFTQVFAQQGGGDKLTFALKAPGDVPTGVVNAEIVDGQFVRRDQGFAVPSDGVIHSTIPIQGRVIVVASLVEGGERILSVGGQNEPVLVPASGTVAVREGRRLYQGSTARIDEFLISIDKDQVRFVKSHSLPIGEVKGLALTSMGLIILWEDSGEQQFTTVPRDKGGKLDFSLTSAEPMRADHVVAIASDGTDLLVLTNREVSQLAKLDVASGSFISKEIWALDVDLESDASIAATASGAIYLANGRSIYRLRAEASDLVVEFPLHSHVSAISSR